MIYFNKNQLYYLYAALLLLALLSLLPVQALAADVLDITPPSVTVDNIKVVDGVTMINGHVSDDQTTANLILLELYGANDQLIDTIVPLSDGTWSYQKAITQKPNTLYIKATDTAPVPNAKTFPVDNQRPHVKSINIPVFLSKDQTTHVENNKLVDLLKNEDMTRVSINPTITITLEDNDVIDNLDITNPITVFSKSGTVSGTASLNDKKQIVYSLTGLAPSTNYYIIFNSSLTDDAGNSVYPILQKFTTVSDTLFNGNYTNYQADWDKLPHGYYTNNVNTCINCHNTHVSEGESLDNPSSTYTPKNQSLMDSYCMACHDGTTAAPMPDNSGSDMLSKHETQSTDHPSKAGSCTSCHNPHLTWNAENPNLLKDHYVFKHKDEDMVDGVKVGEVDSRNQLCEKCHELNTNYYKNLASDLVKNQKDPNNSDAYKIMHYQKFSSVGTVENYNLCFSCHNDQEKNGAKNILKYYQDSDTKHLIKAKDGSPLNGQIPCSVCHETHGSKNLNLLKDKLGQENKKDFSFTSGDWDVNNQKKFCTTCHNGSTAIFGVTGPVLDPLTHGHEENSPDACSTCHGGESKSFIEAAHDPKLPNTAPPAP